jgi:hypothetical protein
MTTEAIDGRFPTIANVIPKTRPMFTFRVDPRMLAETLLAMSALLPDEAQGVQVFFYGKDTPIGLCARNFENGMMIDALVVPLTEAGTQGYGNGKPKEEAKPKDAAPTDSSPPTAASSLALVQRYEEAKQRHPGMLLLFRNGDYHELFNEDAEKAAKILGLTLTTLTSGDKTIPMCGFRHYQAQDYLQKLVRDGQRVAFLGPIEPAPEAAPIANPEPTPEADPKPNGKKKSKSK